MAPGKTTDSEPVPDRSAPPPTGGATTELIDEAKREQREDEEVWRRIAAALRRDWEETHVHVFPSDAAHAEETGGRPSRNPEDSEVSWPDVEPAIRFGHDAVTRYPDEDRWTADLESRLRDDWTASEPAMPWSTASRMVRYGWDYRRKRML